MDVIKQITEEFNLTRVMPNRAYGQTQKGIPFTAMLVSNNLQLIFMLRLKNPEEKKEVANQIKKMGFFLRQNADHLVLSTAKTRKIKDSMRELLNLVDQGKIFEEMDECPICHQSHCDRVGVYQGRMQRVHTRCWKEVYLQKKEQLQRNEGHYVTGAIGAFLGALLVTLAGLLIMKVLDISFGIIFACSGSAAVFGYKKLKGKLDRGSRPIIIGMSLLAFVVYLYALVYLYAFDHFNFFNYLELIPYLTSGIFSVEFISSCWFEILFFTMGLIAASMDRSLSATKLLEDLETEQSISKEITVDMN